MNATSISSIRQLITLLAQAEMAAQGSRGSSAQSAFPSAAPSPLSSGQGASAASAASAAPGATAASSSASTGYNPNDQFDLSMSLSMSLSANSDKCGCPCEKPAPQDSCHPSGSLTKDDSGTITTPGGYKIKPTGKNEFTITGADGKTTKVWGDPHVTGSDGKSFEFKKNSSFVLDDGTKIDVNTSAPDKNGATYTNGLQVTNGNDRVQVTDMDKGVGKVSDVTQDGLAHAHDFDGNDVFTEGANAGEWSHPDTDGKGAVDLGKGAKAPTAGQDPMQQGQDATAADPVDRMNALGDQLANGNVPEQQADSLGNGLNSIQDMFQMIEELLQMFTQFSQIKPGGMATA